MIVYLNGQFLPREQASIDPFDRGFIFGDGVYEGLRSIPDPHPDPHRARIIGLNHHITRMANGLREADIPFDPASLAAPSLELLRRNNLRDAFVYWQVTRGTPHPGDPVRSRVPPPNLRPTTFAYCSPQPPLESFDAAVPTKSAVTLRDIRWEMGHLKSTSLMGNIRCASAAAKAGAEEAILLRGGSGDDGVVAEGLATNVLIVSPIGEIATPSLNSASILAGVTRAILLRECPEIVERTIRPAELGAASEILLVGTTTMVTAITRLNAEPVSGGRPGPVARRLLTALLAAIRSGRDIE